MFYSHNLLARKGPLGTVWCAAHLQNRLKKSSIITINIPNAVDQIMNPQVPLALRMSGHLLLGVVRIYSKKVDYLQQDYNVLRVHISKASSYSYPDINLPEEANQARFETITLPDNFALDLMDIDDHYYISNGSPDVHLQPNQNFTFTDYSRASSSNNPDQTPPAGYIMISVGEDASQNLSPVTDNIYSASGTPSEEQNPHTPPPYIVGVQDPDPNGFNEDNVPSQEHGRLRTNPFLPDTVEPDLDLLKEILEGKTNDSLKMDEFVVNDGPSSPTRQTSPQAACSEPLPVQRSLDTNELPPSSPQDDFPRSSPRAELAPTPPPAAQTLVTKKTPATEQAPVSEQPRVKRRRVIYDEATVLTNEFMKKSIDDASHLKRKRKGSPSFLGVWKLNNTYKREKVFFDPLITGMSDNLCQMFEDGYISTKPHLMTENKEDVTDAMETERAPEFEDPTVNSTQEINSPVNGTSYSSPQRTEDANTPATVTTTNIWSKSDTGLQTTVGTGIGSTTDLTSSNASFESVMEAFQYSQSQQGSDNNAGPSNISEELSFMEDNEDSSIGSRGTSRSSGSERLLPETGTLLRRTRAVAKFIKEKSTATPSTSDGAGSVSMISILHGKTRKVCSRMFFETLVLKTCDFVDVKQDEPFGDITLMVTPNLLKLQFSN